VIACFQGSDPSMAATTLQFPKMSPGQVNMEQGTTRAWGWAHPSPKIVRFFTSVLIIIY